MVCQLVSCLLPLRIFFIGAFLVGPSFAGPSPAKADLLRVFVSVLPQKTFVEAVGGEQVEVRAMVRPGHSPATYAPTPKQIGALAATDLYLRIGVPFEDAWMERIRAANPDLQVLDARAGIDLSPIEHQDHGGIGHTGEKVPGERPRRAPDRDPHIWTSPMLVKRIAGNIRDALSRLDPANGEDYARNYRAFAAELDALDGDIRSVLEDAPNRKFMVFHPAWGYFADAYRLTQVPIENEGKEPGARALTALIEQAKRENVKVVFVQPQFDKKSSRQVARAIGGRVVAIDPLAADYVDNLRQVAGQIAAAARK
jgi:zinc transport system substrate-binding protein